MNSLNLCINLELDLNGSPYVSACVPQQYVKPYLRMLNSYIEQQDFSLYTGKQQRRDAKKHHITVINSIEYEALKPNDISQFLGYPIHVKMLGLGHIKEIDNEVYFIACQCTELATLRAHLLLPPVDFHITLGFKISDIFDKPKDIKSLIYPFSKIEGYRLLKNEH
jgi:hypothetical protein